RSPARSRVRKFDLSLSREIIIDARAAFGRFVSGAKIPKMAEKLTILESVTRLWRRYQVFLIIVGIVLTIALYVAGVPHNPPGSLSLAESSLKSQAIRWHSLSF